jgi:3-methylfumaryl-CoA hydratase
MEISNPDALRTWVGRVERRTDEITPGPLRALWTILDRQGPLPEGHARVPPLWHWLYFIRLARPSQLGVDGHALMDGLLPPMKSRQRMWAGGSIEFHQPLCVGDKVVRESRILDVRVKSGRSGDLTFIGIGHEIIGETGLAISEVQDIVYRHETRYRAPTEAVEKAPTNETFCHDIFPSPVLLFQYSALTFNSHRIHYDRSYAADVEGYPGLVVQGPLVATLLIELLQQQKADATPRRISFKAVSPLFDSRPFHLCGRAEGSHEFALWARDSDGRLAMSASAQIA